MSGQLKFKALGRVTIYNLETGEASACQPVDARERLARGGWSLEPVAVEKVEGPDMGLPVGGLLPPVLGDMTVKDLRAYAKEQGISIPADATTKEAIIAVIEAGKVEA